MELLEKTGQNYNTAMKSKYKQFILYIEKKIYQNLN